MPPTSSPAGARMASRAARNGSVVVREVVSVIGSSHYPMRQRREIAPGRTLRLEVKLRDDDTLAAAEAREHRTPVIDDHAVTVGLAAAGVRSPLPGGDDETQVFDGARA